MPSTAAEFQFVQTSTVPCVSALFSDPRRVSPWSLIVKEKRGPFRDAAGTASPGKYTLPTPTSYSTGWFSAGNLCWAFSCGIQSQTLSVSGCLSNSAQNTLKAVGVFISPLPPFSMLPVPQRYQSQVAVVPWSLSALSHTVLYIRMTPSYKRYWLQYF